MAAEEGESCFAVQCRKCCRETFSGSDNKESWSTVCIDSSGGEMATSGFEEGSRRLERFEALGLGGAYPSHFILSLWQRRQKGFASSHFKCLILKAGKV